MCAEVMIRYMLLVYVCRCLKTEINLAPALRARQGWTEFHANIAYYYMALSHKDWELPNSRIWLAKTDIDRGLDFPI